MAQVFLVDTNVLWNVPLCNRLTEKIESGLVRVYIPTLVHAERIRQVADQHGEQFSIDVVRQFLDNSLFEMLPFTVEDAEAVADLWLDLKRQGHTQNYWRIHRFDIILCSVARARGYTLVTDDLGDHFQILSPMNTTQLEEWLDESGAV